MDAILGIDLPALAPGSVWFVAAASPPSRLVRHALRQADVAVVDAALAAELGAGSPATCRIEAASAAAAERCRVLASAGWRVLRLVSDDPAALRGAAEDAARLSVAGTPYRILLMVDAAAAAPLRTPHPLEFSMSGVAG
jgi:siroheme synthase